jgi:hypothetical protein
MVLGQINVEVLVKMNIFKPKWTWEKKCWKITWVFLEMFWENMVKNEQTTIILQKKQLPLAIEAMWYET